MGDEAEKIFISLEAWEKIDKALGAKRVVRLDIFNLGGTEIKVVGLELNVPFTPEKIVLYSNPLKLEVPND